MADHDALISNFCALTAADPEQARHYLEASKWDINTAVNQYFGGDNANDGEDSDDDMEEEEDSTSHAPAHAPTGGTASSSRQTAGGSRPNRLVSLSDLRGDGEEDSDSDGEERQKDFFAGGEKSGLAIKEPGKGGKDIIHNILNKAQGEAERRQGQPQAAGPSRSHFTSAGQTLGSDDSPSVVVPNPVASQPRAPEIVNRSLTFWRDGFSIEDGPLMRYDDPANQEILRAIQSGRAPTAIMGVQQGQQADVHVFKRLDEDYVPPKKKYQPFAGQGNRLGSPTPEVSASSSSSVAAPTPQATRAPAAPAAPQVDVDSSQPATSLQIRLGDGTRLVSRFNHTHTVGDIYTFVNSASVISRSRDYVLQTTFPNKELIDHSQTVKDAGLVNAVIVQKWR